MDLEKYIEEYRKELKSKYFLSEPQLDLACQGFKDGFNKISEWHRLDEGIFPSKEQLGETFNVAFAFNENTQKYYSLDCAEYIDKGKFITHTFDGSNENNADKIIAWKEIV